MKRVFQSAALLLILMALSVPGLALVSCATGAHQHSGCTENCPMMPAEVSTAGMSMSVAAGSCCQVRSGAPASSSQQAAAPTSHYVSFGATPTASADPLTAVTNKVSPISETTAPGETPPSLAALCTFLI